MQASAHIRLRDRPLRQPERPFMRRAGPKGRPSLHKRSRPLGGHLLHWRPPFQVRSSRQRKWPALAKSAPAWIMIDRAASRDKSGEGRGRSAASSPPTATIRAPMQNGRRALTLAGRSVQSRSSSSRLALLADGARKTISIVHLFQLWERAQVEPNGLGRLHCWPLGCLVAGQLATPLALAAWSQLVGAC